jgi:hypothetical protein
MSPTFSSELFIFISAVIKPIFIVFRMKDKEDERKKGKYRVISWGKRNRTMK